MDEATLNLKPIYYVKVTCSSYEIDESGKKPHTVCFIKCSYF
jgi:hypothetical protein